MTPRSRDTDRAPTAGILKARSAVLAVIAVFAVSPLAFAQGAAAEGRGSTGPHRAATFVVASSFEPVLEDVLGASPTVRRQFERIATAAGVRVYITLTLSLPSDRLAQTDFRSSADGFEARVEIATPLRAYEYAELLAHEFEHVLEQLEGVNLVSLARRGERGVERLPDGAYETERAIGAGRRASLEVSGAVRQASAHPR